MKKYIGKMFINLFISFYMAIMFLGKSIESAIEIEKSIVIFVVMFFLGLHVVFKIADLYNFIFKHRFKIACIILIFATILGVSGSSIGMLANFVGEPEQNTAILGVPRAIRSDESIIITPISISQTHNDFTYFNNKLGNRPTDVFTIIKAPVKSILSIGSIFNIGYILFGAEAGLAFWWTARLLSIMLISFELCLIITNQNKRISAIGMLLISFSGTVQWWFSSAIVDCLIWGMLAIVMIDKFMNTTNLLKRLMYSTLFAICAISYVFTFYLPSMIAFAYAFFALAIWIVIRNKDVYKFYKRDILLILLIAIIVLTFGVIYYNTAKDVINAYQNTSYPGSRVETGGNGINIICSYMFNFLYPYFDYAGSCVGARMLSFFPFLMICTIIYMVKYKKNFKFLIPMMTMSVFLLIWILIGYPAIVGKITFLNVVTVQRAIEAFEFLQVLILVFLLSRIKENEKLLNIPITLVLVNFVMLITYWPNSYFNMEYLIVISIVLYVQTILLVKMNEIKYRNILISFLIILSITTGCIVNPINRTNKPINETKFAKAVQSELKQNENSLWIYEGEIIGTTGILVANNATTINSVHPYPDEEFIHKILGNKTEENKESWNRYAYIFVDIYDGENSIELYDTDKIKLKINYEKVKELGIDYIVTNKRKNYYEIQKMNLKEVYSHDFNYSELFATELVKDYTGVYIYEVFGDTY